MARFFFRLLLAWLAEAPIIEPPDPKGPLLYNVRNVRSKSGGLVLEFDADVNPAALRGLARICERANSSRRTGR